MSPANFYPILWFGKGSECLFISGSYGSIDGSRPVIFWPMLFSEMTGREVFDIKDPKEDRCFCVVKVGFC